MRGGVRQERGAKEAGKRPKISSNQFQRGYLSHMELPDWGSQLAALNYQLSEAVQLQLHQPEYQRRPKRAL